MEIPDPLAFPEERVLVLNYRMKPAQWEAGEVRDILFRPTHSRTAYDGGRYEIQCSWSYDIFVGRPITEDRYGRRGGGYVLVGVRSDAIRLLGAVVDHAEGSDADR